MGSESHYDANVVRNFLVVISWMVMPYLGVLIDEWGRSGGHGKSREIATYIGCSLVASWAASIIILIGCALVIAADTAKV